MSAGGRTGNAKDERLARERARVYRARREFHERQVRRRRVDDIVLGVGGGALIVGAIAVQTLFYTAGPGSVAPAPTPAVDQVVPTAPAEILPTLIPLSPTSGTDG